MNSKTKLFCISLTLILVAGCSSVLQTVNLSIDEEDTTEQEKYRIVIKPSPPLKRQNYRTRAYF